MISDLAVTPRRPVTERTSGPAGRPPAVHVFETGDSDQRGVLIVDGSRIHRLQAHAAELLQRAEASGRDDLRDAAFAALGLSAAEVIETTPPSRFPVRALSLAIAQKCNLGCTYCYAEGGDFGGAPATMSREVADAAVEQLFRDVGAGETVRLAFLGGEPLTNRAGLQAAVEQAERLAVERDAVVRFSLTTNGTLLNAADAVFLARHRFNVTVSLDGPAEIHDRQRPFKGGRGSFRRIAERLAPLVERQGDIELSARVTVTPRNLDLSATLEALSALGFQTIGFSPMVSSPTGAEEMATEQFDELLAQMTACGRAFEESLRVGRPHPFANLASALFELHRGTHRPYPCGAGAGYLGVSAGGELSACHRFVGDPSARFGDVWTGLDQARQTDWLAERHVQAQDPCRSCWARYLCGGGCHHEVIRRGRPACDFIRGWLDYCLGAYVRLVDPCAWWFEGRPPPAQP
jgi:uncharacterized protein